MVDALVEDCALVLVCAKFGPEAKIIFEPVPSDFPLSAQAKALFDKRIAEARIEARAAIALVGERCAQIADGEAASKEYERTHEWGLDASLNQRVSASVARGIAAAIRALTGATNADPPRK